VIVFNPYFVTALFLNGVNKWCLSKDYLLVEAHVAGGEACEL